MSVIFIDKSAEEFRALASNSHQASHDSFERCDTDGFISQWAHDTMASGYHLAAQVAENGGYWEFPALFDLQGNLVPARTVDGKYGLTWLVLDNWDGLYQYGLGNAVAWIKPLHFRESGEYTADGIALLEPSPKSIAYAAKRGYRYGTIRMKGIVISHGGKGGYTSVGWHVAPLRGERYENAEIVDVI